MIGDDVDVLIEVKVLVGLFVFFFLNVEEWDRKIG